MRSRRVLLALLVLAAACDRPQAPPTASDADAQGHTAPSQRTAAANSAVAESLPLADQQDFEDARRGLVASDPDVEITDANGRRVWNTTDYDFVTGDPPASVNPSLWRQAKLNGLHGLFEVAPGIHQVRGYDLANMTIIAGTTGWIVVDPLGSRETAAAALALARRQLGTQPIRAVIFTHSHVDHFGGIDGVLPDAAARAGVRIIAPKGFIEEATSENVLAGLAMGRRATFMYGMPLARSPRGHVDTGLGKGPSRGALSITEPTELVDHTPQPMDIDGVPFVFQYVPGSEAPAELTFYLPDAKAFCAAEITSHTLHNLYTLRGAKVRDALRWSAYIDEAITLFPDAEIVFASHHWPVWDRVRVRTYLEQQRDTYRYLHDQTLRLANGGATPQEIAEQLELPPSLRNVFASRGYYGTVRHNAKAVYQNYFGWYDGNPANLDPLPPTESSTRYVEAMGGADAVIRRAAEAAGRGEYRWAATLLNHVVFADPKNTGAREQLAATYDQLGYQAESGPWRDEYLTGAFELRHGVQPSAATPAAAADLLLHLPLQDFFASLAARVDGPAADGKDTIINMTFSDLGETWVLSLQNAVLHASKRAPDPNASATVTLSRPFLVRLITGQSSLRELVFSDELQVDGSRMALLSLLMLLERPSEPFAIVTP
ncbi:MAG TPA: alkyl sulfatase dimerization domain-containing protein [Candidatus Binatia bacterium]|nr:alkyl sulfatase dimerization domain-containing protein [Candidatus Binatia bacterium]